MEHWKEQSTNNMLQMKSEQGYNFQHPDYHNPSSSQANYSHYYTYPVMPTSGNTGNQNLHQFMYHYVMNVKNEDQWGAMLFCHPVPSYDSSGVAPYNHYNNADSHNAYINGSTSQFCHLFAPLNNGSSNQYAQSTPMTTGVIMNEQFSQSTPAAVGVITNEHFPQSTSAAVGVMTNVHSGNYHINDSHRVAYKKKHPHVVTVDPCAATIPANPDLSSASSSQLLHEEPNENGFDVMTPAASISPEYHENVEVPTAGGQHGTQRSNYNAASLQQLREFPYSNYIGHSFQPPSFGWVEQHENYSHAGGYYNWNYMGPVNYVDGRSLQSGAPESMNMHMREYKEATTYGNPAFVLPPPPIPNQQQHLPSPQSMQVHSYSQNTQTVAPSYWHPVSSLQTSNRHPTVDDTNSAYRSPRSFIPEVFNWSLHEAAEDYEDPEESWTDSVSDQHGDLRLDIEDMSYEELLALEERIGDVNTGLSEDSILKNLKTSVCAPLTLSLLDLSSRLLNEKCMICLVEYEEHERIGTLDCGHSYHADCIKEWLLIKNLCPICKTSALASGRKET